MVQRKDMNHKRLVSFIFAVVLCCGMILIKPTETQAASYAAKLYSLQSVYYGTSGNSVYFCQELLQGLGYYYGTIDGSCGNMTKNAISSFQTAWGLSVDGSCGPVTWGKLIYAALLYSSVSVATRGRHYGVCLYESKEVPVRCFYYRVDGSSYMTVYY